MIIFQVAFVLVNLTVPYLLWSRKTESTLPQVEPRTIEKTVFNLVESAGGFPPCSSQDVVDYITDLCEQSRREYSEKNTVTFERASDEVVFACEVQKSRVQISWRPEASEKNDLACKINIEQHVDYAPKFSINLLGKLQAIEFNTSEGQRQRTPVLNCRLKLKSLLQAHKTPPTEDDFLLELGRTANDPSDHVTANRVCLIYDVAPAWTAWRKRYYEDPEEGESAGSESTQ
jgi:hypothetical protein